jgi:hypothetical protein
MDVSKGLAPDRTRPQTGTMNEPAPIFHLRIVKGQRPDGAFRPPAQIVDIIDLAGAGYRIRTCDPVITNNVIDVSVRFGLLPCISDHTQDL